MKIGYARGSKRKQNLDMQIDALKKAGCEKIFTEQISTVKMRPQLEKVLEIARRGDTIIVWKLDRLGRSLKQLVNLIEDFRKNEINFVCVVDSIDTNSPGASIL